MLKVTGRMADAYISAQFKYAEPVLRPDGPELGPGGLPGIPLSNYGYERQGWRIEVGTRTSGSPPWPPISRMRSTAWARRCIATTSFTGCTPGPRGGSTLALWEGVVLAGADRNFETRYRNPLSLSYLANTIGLGDRGNVLLGLDVRWRAFGRTTFKAQLALDDFWYHEPSSETATAGLSPSALRDRWAKPAAGSALYTQVSSLALRAFNPFENFTDAGVGIGRNFSDKDQLTLRVTLPVRDRWLLAPELTVLRQGEGQHQRSLPRARRRTACCPRPRSSSAWWSAPTARPGDQLGGPGRSMSGQCRLPPRGEQRAQEGSTVNRFEGRIQATLGFSPERSASMRQSPPPLTRDRVLQLIQRMKSSRVVVVGDIMLDRYLIGDTERLSPEAPVPVVTVRERHAALGGAANVAANVVALGARCLLVGAVGDDADGAAIRQELAVARLEDRHVLTIAGPAHHLQDPDHRPVPADRADR